MASDKIKKTGKSGDKKREKNNESKEQINLWENF